MGVKLAVRRTIMAAIELIIAVICQNEYSLRIRVPGIQQNHRRVFIARTSGSVDGR